MRLAPIFAVALFAITLAVPSCGSGIPSATCDEFDTQPEAQAAVDGGEVKISDPDGDGVYCESLPGAP